MICYVFFAARPIIVHKAECVCYLKKNVWMSFIRCFVMAFFLLLFSLCLISFLLVLFSVQKKNSIFCCECERERKARTYKRQKCLRGRHREVGRKSKACVCVWVCKRGRGREKCKAFFAFILVSICVCFVSFFFFAHIFSNFFLLYFGNCPKN